MIDDGIDLQRFHLLEVVDPPIESTEEAGAIYKMGISITLTLNTRNTGLGLVMTPALYAAASDG